MNIKHTVRRGRVVVRGMPVHLMLSRSRRALVQAIEQDFGYVLASDGRLKFAGMVIPSRARVIMALVPRREPDFSSVVLHECIHAAQFIQEIKHGVRMQRLTRKRGFDEPFAYVTQDLFFRVMTWVRGEPTRRLPFADPS